MYFLKYFFTKLLSDYILLISNFLNIKNIIKRNWINKENTYYIKKVLILVT